MAEPCLLPREILPGRGMPFLGPGLTDSYFSTVRYLKLHEKQRQYRLVKPLNCLVQITRVFVLAQLGHFIRDQLSMVHYRLLQRLKTLHIHLVLMLQENTEYLQRQKF